MKIAITFLFCLFGYAVYAQDEWVDIAVKQADSICLLGESLMENEQYGEAAAKYKEAISLVPQTSRYHHLTGTCLYYAKQVKEALPYLREAFITSPGNMNYALDYLMVMVVNEATIEEIKPLIGHTVQLFSIPDLSEKGFAALQDLLQDTKTRLAREVIDFYALKKRETSVISKEVFQNFEEIKGYARDGRLNALADQFQRMEASIRSIANPYTILIADLYANVSLELLTGGYTDQASLYGKKVLAEAQKWPAFLANQATMAIVSITANDIRKGNYQQALDQVNNWIKQYSTLPVSFYQRFELLSFLPFLHAQLGQFGKAVESAGMLENIAKSYKGSYYAIETAHAYLKAYMKGPSRKEVEKAIAYGKKAVEIARNVNYIGLIEPINQNIKKAEQLLESLQK
jgi:tetratricopeptide (TPR) repeat protein